MPQSAHRAPRRFHFRRLPPLFALPLIGFLAIVSTEGTLAQWHQFGGPTRDFKSTETGLLDRWPEEGPALLWDAAHEGNYASILVDGDSLYSMFKEGDDFEVVRSLHAHDGSTRWEFKYPIPEIPEKVMLNFDRGPNATPAIAGDRIVGVGFLGHVWCLDKRDGTVLWSHDLLAEYGAKVHTFGYSISPLIHGEQVIIAVGGDRDGIIAFDLATGKPTWRSQPIDVSYASPMVIVVDGMEQLLLLGSLELVSLDPQDGRILWRFPHRNLNRNNCSMPLWGDDGRLIIGSHSDGGASALTLDVHDNSGRKLTHIHESWHSDEIVFFHTSALWLGDVVYTNSGHGPPNDLLAFDVATGKVLWREPGYAKANLLLADGKVIVANQDGTIALTRMTPDGLTTLSSFRAIDPTAWAPPTLADGVLYVRDQKRVKAFQLRAKVAAKRRQGNGSLPD